MDRKTAIAIVNLSMLIGEKLNELHGIIEALDQAEKTPFKRGVGELMGTMYTDIMIPIIRQYPDLDPDKV